MLPGIREAARAMFTSPIFLASVALSILVYLAAWVAPEPFFSKAAVAALTVRLAMLVGVLELRCIDDARCGEARHWMPEDGQPEKVGQYHVVSGLRIDPTKGGDAHIFRTWGWTVALIVSEELKEAMEQAGITGPIFVEV